VGFSIHLAKQNYYVDIDSFLIRLLTGVAYQFAPKGNDHR